MRCISTVGFKSNGPHSADDPLQCTSLFAHRQAQYLVKLVQMVKGISAKLKQASEKANKKIANSKPANKFQSLFKKFRKDSQLAAEVESVYSLLVNQEASSSRSATVDVSAERSEEQQSLLVEYKRLEGLVLENEISTNEAEIEEGWNAIEEIQYQIEEIKAIYKDLSVVVHEHGTMNYGIGSYGARTAASQGKIQLMKAAEPQRSYCFITCFLVIFGMMILIVILVLTSW